MMATNVADLVATLRMDAGQFTRTSQQVAGQTQSMASGFGKLGTALKAVFTVAVIKQVADFGATMFKVGVESEAMGLRYRAVFGQNTAELDRWIEANRSAFGMAQDDMQGFVANVANMLTPLGMTTEEAGKQTTEILELANAWSVWSGGQTSSAQAAEALTKGILGQTRGLVDLGMKISEEEVAAKLAEAGVENLTGVEKVRAEALARMELIQERSNAAIRVYDEAMGGAAGAQRKMQTAMAEMKDAIGAMVVELAPLISGLAKVVGFVAGITHLGVQFDGLDQKMGLWGAALRAGEGELGDYRIALRNMGMDEAAEKLDQTRLTFQQTQTAVNALVASLQNLRNALLGIPGNVNTTVTVNGGAGTSAQVGGYIVKNPSSFFGTQSGPPQWWQSQTKIPGPVPQTQMPAYSGMPEPLSGYESRGSGGGGGAPTNNTVTVNVGGSVLSEGGLVSLIEDAVIRIMGRGGRSSAFEHAGASSVHVSL